MRDHLLKRASKDHDIATDASVDEIAGLFPNSIEVGRAFGVVKVPLSSGDPPLEIATFRQESGYEDHRRPTRVAQATPAEDAWRRDFTVNGLFFDPKSQRILDHVDGLTDLHEKKLRAIGIPAERFREDALRLLRAVRIATALQFDIEPETAAALQRESRWIAKVSGERVRDEVKQILIGPAPHLGLQRLADFHLLEWILPEVDAFRKEKSDRWKRTCARLRVLHQEWTERRRSDPDKQSALFWAALLCEVSGPQFERLARRLKFSSAESSRVSDMVTALPHVREIFRMREATIERTIREPFFPELLILSFADARVYDGNLGPVQYWEERFRNFSTGIPRILQGDDLIHLGLKPGPGFSEILRTVEDLALEGKLKDRDEALEFVLKTFVK